MAVSFVSITALASGTGAVTVAAAAGVVADDLILLFVETANEAVVTPTGYSHLPPNYGTSGTAGAAGQVRITTFVKTATGADTTTSIADVGNHLTAYKVVYRGVFLTAPIASSGNFASLASTSNGEQVTTAVAGCRVILATAFDRDAATADLITTFTSGAGGPITDLQIRAEGGIAGGTGGGLAIGDGLFAGVGSCQLIMNFTVSSASALRILGLQPIPPPSDRTATLAATESGPDTFTPTTATVVDPFLGPTGTLNATENTADTFTPTTATVENATYQRKFNQFVNGAILQTPSVYETAVSMIIESPVNGSLRLSAHATYESYPFNYANGVFWTDTQWQYREVGGPSWIDVGVAKKGDRAWRTDGAGDVISTGYTNHAAVIVGASLGVSYEAQLIGRRHSTSATALDPYINFTAQNYNVAIFGENFSASGSIAATGGLDGFAATAAVTGDAANAILTLNAVETGTDTAASEADVLVSAAMAAAESGADTSESVAQVVVQAALAATEQTGDTFEGSAGTVITSTATLAATETGPDTLASDADAIVTAALSVAEAGQDSMAGLADVFIAAALSATEAGPDALVSASKVVVSAGLAASEAGTDTLVSDADAVATSTLAAQEVGADTAASTAVVVVQASMAAAEPGADSADATADVLLQAVVLATEQGADTLAASVETAFPAAIAVLAAQELGDDTLTAAMTAPAHALLDAVEQGADAAEGTATVLASAILSATEAGQDSSDAVAAVIVQAIMELVESGQDGFEGDITLGLTPAAYADLFSVEQGSDALLAFAFVAFVDPMDALTGCATIVYQRPQETDVPMSAQTGEKVFNQTQSPGLSVYADSAGVSVVAHDAPVSVAQESAETDVFNSCD